MAAVDNSSPRYVPPGSCTSCGHDPHAEVCGREIRTGKAMSAPCSCPKREVS